MTLYEALNVVMATVVAGCALVGAYLALSPKRKARRAQRQQWVDDLTGRPARIENGVVVEPARPSLAAAVARIDERTEQLTRNGGATVADAVHRMESSLATKHAENQLLIEQTSAKAQEAARLAQQAAETAEASQVQGSAERQRLEAAISDLRNEVWTRLDGVDLRDQTYLQALAELGVDLR